MVCKLSRTIWVALGRRRMLDKIGPLLPSCVTHLVLLCKGISCGLITSSLLGLDYLFVQMANCLSSSLPLSESELFCFVFKEQSVLLGWRVCVPTFLPGGKYFIPELYKLHK